MASFNTDLRDLDPDVFGAIQGEISRQRETLEMIASENFVPRAVLQAQGGGGFTNGHGTAYADDERHVRGRVAQEGFGGGGELLPGGDLHVDKAGEGEIDVCDLVQINAVTDAAKFFKLVFCQHLRHRFA